MFVCHCRAVTDGAVRATIAEGACSLRDLAEGCGAGSRCGGCHLVLQRMLADAGLLPADSVPTSGYCAA
ncbi:MAG: bacterioferritin-associated ferredoxin [Acidimicrobiia bacterium]